MRRAATYGTISRVKIKPGHESEIEVLEQEFLDKIRPGIADRVLWLRGSQNDHPEVTVTIFLCENKSIYTKLSDDSTMDELFGRMMAHYEAEPTWEDVEFDAVYKD